MSKRSPEEILKALEEQGVEDEAREIAAMSRAEIDAELERAGLDPEHVTEGIAKPSRVRSEGTEEGRDDAPEPAAWVSEPPPPSRIARRGFTRRSVWLLAAALAALVGGGAVAAGVWSKHEPKPIDEMPDAAPRPAPAPPAPSVPFEPSPAKGDDKPKPPR